MSFLNKIKEKATEFVDDKIGHWSSPEEKLRVTEERHNICRGCEHYFKITDQCKECGCIIKWKTKIYKSKCPIGKW